VDGSERSTDDQAHQTSLCWNITRRSGPQLLKTDVGNEELFVKRSKTGPRSGVHGLKSWKELEVFSLEVRRLRRNVFLEGKKLDKEESNKPSSISTWRREQGLNFSQIQIRYEDKISSIVN